MNFSMLLNHLSKKNPMFPFEPGGKFNSANVKTKETSDEFSDVTQPLVKEEPNAMPPIQMKSSTRRMKT